MCTFISQSHNLLVSHLSQQEAQGEAEGEVLALSGANMAAKQATAVQVTALDISKDTCLCGAVCSQEVDKTCRLFRNCRFCVV